ncbi:hypothetical protein DFQ27_004474 [Actinomortierella ambigua]|uniref:RRM domain-containing protein n=1 Tax=Actinomortierella ambigua TaxID=1343610 RepID=A0A9P6Q4G7_9FUNG|nr:hypothetical protein DFQ27_004474 [Actinomortierella ambigua]
MYVHVLGLVLLHLTEERFREHFGTKGEVTDAKLMKNSWGKSRGFGFIGFKDEKDAKAALNYFNNTFIDTSKIVVEKAIEIGSENLPRAWSQYTSGSSANARKQAADRQKKEAADQVQREKTQHQADQDMQKKKEQISKLYKVESDPKLREYLEVMQSRPTAKTWANDDAVELNTEKAGQHAGGKVKAQAMVTAVKNRKPGGEGLTVTQTKIKFDDSDDELYDNLPTASKQDEKEEEEEEEFMALTSSEPVKDDMVNNEEVSDLDWLRSRMKPTPEQQEQSKDEDGDEEMEEEKEKEEDKKAEQPTKEADQPTIAKPVVVQIVSAEDEAEATRTAIADTGRLFVRNLPYGCTEEELRALFEKFGPLSEIHMPINKDTKKPVGYAFVMFLMPEHAVTAFNALDKKFFQGRLLHIIASKDKPQKEEGEDSILGPGGKPLSLKKQRELKRKGQSGMDFNWNTLYMNPDAIAASIADRLNISKADILNPEADNMSVRMAVAETQIIMETKTFLQEEGIDVDAFGGKKRSDTVLLVKNIPFSTTELELSDLFGTYGDLGRVLMPPAKTIAIVEFLQPSEARAAFSHLAYRRFKDSILYLEKAPVGVFTKAYDPSMKDKKKNKNKAGDDGEGSSSLGKMSSTQLMEATTTAEDAQDTDNVEGSTLFIKNINFKTTNEGLRKAFAALAGLKSTVIRQKPDPKNAGKTLSMGFGFAEFATKEQAMAAMKAMNGFVLEGNKLEIKFSDRGSTSGAKNSEAKGKKTAPKGHGTKLLVRNIPFEATKKDIMALFKTFGQLKSVRLPKKMTGEHRGFAFLDFVTKQEAKNVYENVANTHLLGRHLVLEWAEEDSSLDVLREKTGRQFHKDDGNAGKKRRKVDLDGDAEEMMMMDMDD